jgi:HAD superfamily phosphatase (TIGR01668 family)
MTEKQNAGAARVMTHDDFPVAGTHRRVHGYRSIFDLPLSAYAEQGCKVLILDIDNTLVDPPPSEDIDPRIRGYLEQVSAQGWTLVILSNGKQARVDRFLQHFPVDLAIARAKKPLPGAFHRIHRELGVSPAAMLVVGDQMLTDGLGGWFFGAKVALVHPRTPERTSVRKVVRWADDLLRRLFKV